jgi:hypothetical protein
VNLIGEYVLGLHAILVQYMILFPALLHLIFIYELGLHLKSSFSKSSSENDS